jgi:hypothetical protein
MSKFHFIAIGGAVMHQLALHLKKKVMIFLALMMLYLNLQNLI